MQFFLGNLCYFKKQNNIKQIWTEFNLVSSKDVKQTIFIIIWTKNVFLSEI